MITKLIVLIINPPLTAEATPESVLLSFKTSRNKESFLPANPSKLNKEKRVCAFLFFPSLLFHPEPLNTTAYRNCKAAIREVYKLVNSVAASGVVPSL